MEKGERKIILCGSIAINRIMNFSGHYKDLIQPDKIHILSLSVLIDRLTHTHGGTSANIAYALSLLGEKPVLIGAVGSDGQEYVKELASHGVDTTRVRLSQRPTATFTVLTDVDNNQVGGFYPGAMSEPMENSLGEWYGQNAIIVISAHDPEIMKQQVRACKENHLSLVYDVGQQVSNVRTSDLSEGIDAATVLILNDYELSVLCKRTGKSAAAIKKQIPLVITTLGSLGSRIEGSLVKEPIAIGSVPDVVPLDPTGAGDAYRAGFLYGYSRHWDLKICGQLGAVIAAYAVETQGTQEYTFTKESLAERYQKAFNEMLPTI